MATKSTAFVLRYTRFVIALLFIGSCVNVLATLFSAGHTTGHPSVPADTMTLRLNLAHPHYYTFEGTVRDMKRGWQDAQQDALAVPRPAPFTPDSVAPSFNRSGFELLADTDQQIVRYREPSLWRRVALLWLGASHETMALSTALILTALTWLLWRLLRDVTPATPFTQTNARRLRQMLLLIVGWIVWQQLAHLFLSFLMPAFSLQNLALPVARYVELNGDAQAPEMWMVMVLSVVALMYRRGVELSQEAELTI
ncbi:DUF2975 domain-containing protein [Hymenobacter weizhouensis]|uniref:DUF2975 domain-containing protein n=1 Tax=Hymenobacter sp. YIM 151500-1 TaxID=2987689 RepID=UPI002226D7C8|nr:DUF2975 domain-containing protein [Hymenobacter sp. YIM 151500-1]UYZ62803.1 DUF2975 domain-containing protein [Hymenobacter sp. YIM 151500-1]